MYHLVFNGKLECKYPNEFLEDFEKLKEKHSAFFIGDINVYDIGEFVDYQEQCNETSENSNSDISSSN